MFLFVDNLFYSIECIRKAVWTKDLLLLLLLLQVFYRNPTMHVLKLTRCWHRQSTTALHCTALALNGKHIERLSSYKLLGLHVTDTSKCNERTLPLCSMAAQRLDFLQQLNIVMSREDLLFYYHAVSSKIRQRVGLYMRSGVPVWHINSLNSWSPSIDEIWNLSMVV